MEKLPLFANWRGWAGFVLLCALLFGLNLFLKHQHFLALSADRFTHTQATVTNQTLKHNQSGTPYWVLRLHSPTHGTFYTTTYERLRPILYREVTLTLITDQLTFRDYLRGFYAPSFRISLLPDQRPGTYERILTHITDQHPDPWGGQLFGALSLASPIDRQLREEINRFGIAHLVALSGFHLGILTLLIAGVLNPPYRLLHRRFFPWRNRFFDLGAITFALLLSYLLFTQTPPSLLRAFGMFAFGLFLLSRHIRLLSFVNLLAVVLSLIALFPGLLFSIGFGLSVAGVFYIFLYLRDFDQSIGWKNALLVGLYVFVAMLPIVHFWFPLTSFTQWLSPVLSLLFVPFYPAALVLHLIGLGQWAAWVVMGLFEWRLPVWEVSTPLWFLALYLLASLLAAWQAKWHKVLLGLMSLWVVWHYGLSAL